MHRYVTRGIIDINADYRMRDSLALREFTYRTGIRRSRLPRAHRSRHKLRDSFIRTRLARDLSAGTTTNARAALIRRAEFFLFHYFVYIYVYTYICICKRTQSRLSPRTRVTIVLDVNNFNGPNPMIVKYGVSRKRERERTRENRRPLIAPCAFASSGRRTIDVALNNG